MLCTKGKQGYKKTFLLILDETWLILFLFLLRQETIKTQKIFFHQSRTFESKHHGSLQEMWYQAHYKEAANVRGRDLGKSIYYSFTHYFVSYRLRTFDDWTFTYSLNARMARLLNDVEQSLHWEDISDWFFLVNTWDVNKVQMKYWVAYLRSNKRILFKNWLQFQ